MFMASFLLADLLLKPGKVNELNFNVVGSKFSNIYIRLYTRLVIALPKTLKLFKITQQPDRRYKEGAFSD